MTEVPEGWVLEPLIKHLVSKSGDSKIIKGKQSSQPRIGLVQGFSASGPDVWVPDAQYSGQGIIVSAVGARCGKTFQAKGDWTAIANTHVLVPSAECGIDFKWLWYLTNNEDFWIRSGTAQPFVKVKDTLLRPQLIPPLVEQKRIVEAIDNHLSKLDKALAAVETSVANSSNFRRAFLEQTYFGDSSISTANLGEHLQTRKNKGIPSQDAGAKYLGLEHVESHGGRVLGFDSAGKYRSSSPLVEEGDVLYGRLRPYLNKVVVAPERLYVSGEFIVMMPNKTLDKTFLKYLLMTPRFLAFTALLDTGDRPRVSWDKIANFEFPLPELDRQIQIVEQIETSLVVSGSIQENVDNLKKQIETLRRSILHAAFSGTLRNGQV
jgi:type I restriction enzyme S subunit